MGVSGALSKDASFEEQQMQRELEASREREVDLSEQLRFAEEEGRKMKRRLQDSQADNEALSRKLDRLVTAGIGTASVSYSLTKNKH
ncbi:hypothetical protein Ciccas_011703 [Cichlidogyrus casuarinus]|uniref:Uncharacterized protein n=1 Tax=Cichlidogyrus casuarinus TaxID=1844966 RepID=A0ABD2PRQ4_9PLAT